MLCQSQICRKSRGIKTLWPYGESFQDMTSPSLSLDHPVAERLGAADLEDEVLPDAPQNPETSESNQLPPQLALRLCLLPQNEAEEVPLPSRDLPESWNLMKAVHHLQGHPRHESPGFSQSIVENWSLGREINVGLAAIS